MKQCTFFFHLRHQDKGAAFTLLTPDSRRWELLLALVQWLHSFQVIATSMHQKATACGEEKAGGKHAELSKRCWGCWVWSIDRSLLSEIISLFEWRRQMFQAWEQVIFTKPRQVLGQFMSTGTQIAETQTYKRRCIFFGILTYVITNLINAFIYLAPLFFTSKCCRLALLQAASSPAACTISTWGFVGGCGFIPLGLMPNGTAAGLLRYWLILVSQSCSLRDLTSQVVLNSYCY